MEGKIQLLRERLDKNLADYHSHLKGLGPRGIIDMAASVAAMSDAHKYLSKHYTFDEFELDSLLLFSNPLELVSDAWEVQRQDMTDMDFIIRGVCERHDELLRDYIRADAQQDEQEAKVAKENKPFGIPTLQNGRKVLADKLDECLLAHFAALQADGQGNIPGLYALSSAVDAHYHMKVEHEYAPAEIEALLKFKDPLEVARYAWEENTHLYSFPICDILKEIDAEQMFPLAEPIQVETKAPASVRAQLAAAAKEVKARPDADNPQKGTKEHGRE